MPTGKAQARIQSLIDCIVAEGPDTSLQVAAYHHGRLIVDAWASCPGHPGRPIDGDSLFPVFSTGKGIAATTVLRLAERAAVQLDAPICRVWPEFAQHGKEKITLRHVLTHTAGLPWLAEHGTLDDLCDWDGVCRFLAASRPLHAPGERQMYHAITYGWLLGEPVRRILGRDFAEVVQAEICRPLGLTSLFIGLPESADPLVADATPWPAPSTLPEPGPVDLAVPPWASTLERFIAHRGVRRACLPASNAIMNARAIAKHYAALLPGGVDGVQLLSDATVREATTWFVPTGLDGSKAAKRGLGFAIGPDDDPGREFGHGGYGGSNGFADRQLGLAVGIAKGRMGGDATGRIEAELRAVVPLDAPADLADLADRDAGDVLAGRLDGGRDVG
jgi:CubicO group peptidase (beta-lactamase class C family)